MLAAHELAALDAADARALESHLLTCAECRAELEQLRETAAALAYVAESLEPAPEVRQRILDNARTQGQASLPKSDGNNNSREAASNAANLLPFNAPAKSRWSALQKFGAIAAALIIAVLLVVLVRSQRDNENLRSEMARINAENQQLQAENARLSNQETELRTEVASLSNRGQQLQTEAERAAQLAREAERNNNNNAPRVTPTPTRDNVLPNDAADQRVVALNGTATAPGARAQLVFNSRTGRTTLTAYNLPPLPNGKTYQLWFIVGGHPVSGGIFNSDQTGHGVLRVQVPVNALNASTFAVTLEPAGGTTAPTGNKYLLGQLS